MLPSRNYKTKLLGNDLLSFSNNLYFFYSQQSDIFNDLIKTIDSDSEVARYKLNVILDNVLGSVPTWSDYIINNK